MALVNRNDILETIRMFSEEHLDIRTVTMGISLLSCAGDDVDTVCDKVYKKIYGIMQKEIRGKQKMYQKTKGISLDRKNKL